MKINLKIRYGLMFICATFGFTIGLMANTQSDSSVVQRFRISYPINKTELYEDYQGNREALEIIQEYFRKSPRIDSIVIYSYASPEGPYSWNKYLAKERGKRAKRYLLEHLPPERNFPDSLIIINSTAENWDGLYGMVSNSYPYDDKEDVLELLSRTDISYDKKKELLKQINGKRPWRYIRSEILPQLRYATWVAEWVRIPELGPMIPQVSTFESDKLAKIDYQVNCELHNTMKGGVIPQEKR